MRPWRLIPAGRFRPMPWRNGGGTTWEIARGRVDGLGADGGEAEPDWHWRFSLAEIAADGPFSVFPQIDRLLTVVAGAGIALTIDGAEPQRLTPGNGIQFPGEAATGCTLLAGPTRDLNLMVDRRVARLMAGGEERRMMAAAGGAILLYALEEVCVLIGTKKLAVAAGDALIACGAAEGVIERGRAIWALVERFSAA